MRCHPAWFGVWLQAWLIPWLLPWPLELFDIADLKLDRYALAEH